MSAQVTPLRLSDLKNRIDDRFSELIGGATATRHGTLYHTPDGRRFNIPNYHGSEVDRVTILKIVKKMSEALGLEKQDIIDRLFG